MEELCMQYAGGFRKQKSVFIGMKSVKYVILGYWYKTKLKYHRANI